MDVAIWTTSQAYWVVVIPDLQPGAEIHARGTPIEQSLLAMTISLPVGHESTYLGEFGEKWFKALCTVAGFPALKVTPDVIGEDFYVTDQNGEIIRV